MGDLLLLRRAHLTVVVLVTVLVLVLAPAAALANFEGSGINGAQLDVTPSDDLPQAATVHVVGRGFVPNDVAQINECPEGFALAETDCPPVIGSAPTDASGGFSADVPVTPMSQNTTCADSGSPGIDFAKCVVVATTYGSGGSAFQTSQATHHICFKASPGAPTPCKGTGPPPPSNYKSPSFTGKAQEGQTLKGDRGGWSGDNISYSYQWRRCGTDGSVCQDIAGATSLDYTLVSADVGTRVKLRVTASNDGGSSSAESGPSQVVTAKPPPPPPAAPCTLREKAFPHPFSDSAFAGFVGNQSTLATDVLWRQESPPASPSAREGAAMAYDAVHKQTVLFGGFVRRPSGECVLGDTWTWDGKTWTKKDPQHSPPARYGHAMASDQNGVVLFGGYDGLKDLGDTWTWDGSDWHKHVGLSAAPPPRARTAMAYDATHHQTVLFGGDHDAKSLDDTWTWDGGAWTQQVPADSPPARGYAAMTYHAATKQVVLQAGWDGGTLYDTWVWDGLTWTLRNRGYGPQAHSGAMAYHPATGLDVFEPGSTAEPGAPPPEHIRCSNNLITGQFSSPASLGGLRPGENWGMMRGVVR